MLAVLLAVNMLAVFNQDNFKLNPNPLPLMNSYPNPSKDTRKWPMASGFQGMPFCPCRRTPLPKLTAHLVNMLAVWGRVTVLYTRPPTDLRRTGLLGGAAAMAAASAVAW